MPFYLLRRNDALCQYVGMDHSNHTDEYIEARREFVRDLARGLAKIIAAADYAAEAEGLESSS